LEFSWDATGTAVIALILKRQSTRAADLSNDAIWGAALSEKHEASVAFNEGHTVQQGHWPADSKAKPAPLEPGGYYFLVQAVSHGELRAISAPVPFIVGESPWKTVGDACESPGVPGDCDSPTFAGACLDGFCQRLCASNLADCGAAGECLQPDAAGVRVCAL